MTPAQAEEIRERALTIIYATRVLNLATNVYLRHAPDLTPEDEALLKRGTEYAAEKLRELADLMEKTGQAELAAQLRKTADSRPTLGIVQ
jgi:hypothetical protein